MNVRLSQDLEDRLKTRWTFLSRPLKWDSFEKQTFSLFLTVLFFLFRSLSEDGLVSFGDSTEVSWQVYCRRTQPVSLGDEAWYSMQQVHHFLIITRNELIVLKFVNNHTVLRLVNFFLVFISDSIRRSPSLWAILASKRMLGNAKKYFRTSTLCRLVFMKLSPNQCFLVHNDTCASSQFHGWRNVTEKRFAPDLNADRPTSTICVSNAEIERAG